MKTRTLRYAAALASAISLQHASATPLIQENFNYTAGALDGQTANGTGLTGTWSKNGATYAVQASSLSFAGHFASSGGSLVLTAGGSADNAVAAQVSATLANGYSVLYTSSIQTFNTNSAYDKYGVLEQRFNSTAAGQSASSCGRNLVSAYNSAATAIRSAAVSADSSEVRQGTGTINAGTNYLLVTKYTISGNNINAATMYVFDQAAYANYLANSTGANADANLATYALFSLTDSGASSSLATYTAYLQFATFKSGSGQIDDFRLGTTVFDVVNVSAAPAISGLTNQTVQVGANATLSATVGGSPTPAIQWYLSTDGGATSNIISGATSSSYSLNNVQYSQNGYQYTLFATNSQGVAASTMTLTVTHTAPTITGLTNQTVYAGNDVTMSATASGVPAPTLQWYNGATPLTDKTNSSLTLTSVSTSDSGTYSLVASNEAGIVTNSMTLTVDESTAPPTITGLTNQTVLDGGSTTLSATIGGNPTPMLHWYLSTDGGTSSNAIGGATSSAYELNGVTYSQNGYVYYLMASNSAGVVVSNMSLTVQQVAPTISGPTNQTVLVGMNATLSATVGGAPTPTLQWQVNESPITSATNATLVLTNIQLSQNGFVYSLVATNPAGALTNSMTLTVNPVPSIFVKLSNGSGAPAPTAINPPTGQAYSGAAPVSGTNWNVVGHSSVAPSGLVAPTNYVVYSALPLSDPSGNSVIPNLTVAFNVYSGSTTRTAPSTANGNIALQPNGVMQDIWRDYEWGSGYFVFTVSNLPPASPFGLYYFGGSQTANQGAGMQLDSNCALGANPTSGRTTNNVLATLGDGVTTSYGSLWNFNGSATNLLAQGSTWNLLYGKTDAAGCYTFTNVANTVSGVEGAWFNGFQIVPLSFPTQAGLTNQTVISGNSTTLSSTVAGLPVPSLQWYSNNVAIVGAATSSLALNNVQYAQDGTVYSLVASNILGAVTNNMTLTVIVTPSITGLNDQAVTTGDTATLNPTVSGVPAPSLQWQLNGVNLTDGATGNGSTISGSTSSTLTITTAQDADSGTYSLIASNSAGIVTNSMVLTVSSGEVAPSITGLTDQTVIQGSNATFSASVSGLPVPTLQWLDQTGTPILGATGNTLTLTNVQYSQDGYVYSLVASNSADIVTNSATLHVLVPASISAQPQNAVVTNTQSASFSVTASGVPSPTYYQWYFNGGVISGGNSATYTIASAAPANMGSYQVVISNVVNAVTSSVATLTVNSTMGYTSLTPANSASGVCYDTPLDIHFDSAPSLRAAGKIRIYNASSPATPVDTIDLSLCTTNHPTLAVNVQAYTIGGMTVTNFPVIISGNIAAIYPHQGLLTSNQTYYVTVDNGTFTDSTGAYFVGITDTNAWRFTTKPAGPANSTSLVVAQDYSGDFATIQGAVNAVPSGNTTPTVINVRNGVYTEFVNVNSRNNIDIRGQSRNGTVIGYPNNNNLNPGAPQRAAFIINGNDCTLETLTLTNMTQVGGGQAEAVDVEGTHAIFYNMELDSHQDTFLVHYSGKLVYFQDSLVAGDTDFNWGYGTVYYTNCEIRSYGAQVTQPRNPIGQRGFGFMNCRITKANAGVSSIGLGRTFGQTNAQALFAYCLMDDVVTGFGDAGSTNTADLSCSNLTATASKSLANSVHLTGSEPDAIAVLSATGWLYGWQPLVAPVILSNPSSQAVDAGQPAAFTVSATGVPAPTYQWTKNGTNLTGETGATLTIPSAQASDIADYAVVVSNSSGSATSSVAKLNLTGVTPNAPTGLSASAGVSQVVLTWSAVPAVTGYNVKRSTTSGGSYVTITNTTATNLLDTTVDNGTTYYYVVSAVNSQGEGSDSVEVNATPQCITPSVPVGFTAAAGSAQVLLTWNASSAASSYNVWRASSSGGSYSLLGNVTATNYTDATVANGTTYYYEVSAVNTCDESGNSPELNATPAAPSVPAYQVNSGGTAVGTYSADANYSGGSAYGSGSSIDTNGLINPAPMSLYQTERWGNSTYTFTSLTAGANYLVRLHFAELYWGTAGGRIFNVSINGSQVLTNFDIVAVAGSNNKAVIREFTVAANGSGQIAIQFTGVVDNAKISGIEIISSLSAPVITSQPADQSVNAGGTATFAATATGSGLTYQWSKDGTALTDQTNSILMVTNVHSSDAGTYYVVMSNNGGSTASRFAALAYSNHNPVAQTMTVSRTAGIDLKIMLSELAINWSDADGNPVKLADVNLQSTNGVTITTNSTLFLYPASAAGVVDQISYTISDGYGGSGVGYINIAINNTPLSGQMSGAFTSFVNNQAHLTFHAVPGYDYVTERSTDLHNWVPVSTNTAATNGVIEVTDMFNDLGGTPPTSSYYRLTFQP